VDLVLRICAIRAKNYISAHASPGLSCIFPHLCIHVDQVAQAFSVYATSPEEFFAEYDFKRPSKEAAKSISGLKPSSGGLLEDLQNSQDSPTFILTADDTSETFDCEDGDLGEKACMILKELGYTNVGLYPDGLSDWRMNGGQTLKGYDDEKKEIDFHDIRKGRTMGTMIIIDVRTKAERQQNGAIKQTICIPLSEVWNTFKMRPDAFKARFNVEKRELKEKQIVLHCLKGKRAFEAADKLLLLGYKNVYVYKGSFIDWTERRGSVVHETQSIRRFSLKRQNQVSKNQLAALEALAAKTNLQSTFVTEEGDDSQEEQT